MSNELIIVKQLPLIEERLKEVSIQIEEDVNKALSLVVNEDSVKEIKKIRANLNKDKTEYEEQRKAVKKAIQEPYNQFEKVYKELITDKYDLADKTLKTRIDDVEDTLKKEKEQNIIDFFNEYAASCEIADIVNYADAEIQVKLTDSVKSLKNKCIDFIDRIVDDLKTINTNENKEEILVEYKELKFDLSKAIYNVNERKRKIEEEKEKAIDNEEEIEETKFEINVPTEELIIEEDKETYMMEFKVFGNIKQLKSVKEFLEKEGIKYE